jgi:hypothetical protein
MPLKSARKRETPMTRLSTGTGGRIAAISAVFFVSTAVVVLSATIVGGRLVALQTARAEAAAPAETALSINRAGKSDALPVTLAKAARPEIKFVEVIGVRDAAIIYRDREGNVLFQTDPLANVTIVSKNVELPEVTIRETEATKVERLPIESSGPAKPHGCESAFARPSPESLTRMSSRCITALPASRQTEVAVLR